MKAIEFPEQTIVIAKDQPEYMPLPARIDGPPDWIITSCWQLSWKERIKLLFTGKLWLQQMTFSHRLQPQRPSVEKPDFK